MAKKILTVEDLLTFCEQNKLYSFDSHKDGHEIVIEMPATFSKEEEDDNQHLEGLAPFTAKAFHDHVNLNQSNIEEDIFQKNLPSANYRPILAHVVQNEDGELDFGAHDYHVVEKDGQKKVVYDEKPVGAIVRASSEYDEDAKVNRAITKGYIFAEYCSDVMEILDRRGDVDCSVELSIRAYSYDAKNKVVNLDDYYVSGLTLLGADKQPGMAGSEFGLDDIKAEFSKDDKLIEILEKLNNTLSNYQKLEKGGTAVTKFEELLQKYGKTAEDITFEYEGLSDEDLEQMFIETFEFESQPEPESTECDINAGKRVFAIVDGKGDIVDRKEFGLSLSDKEYAIFQLVNTAYGDEDYFFTNTFEEDGYTEMHGYFTDKHYRQKFTREGDNFALDGERVEIFAKYLTQEQIDKLEAEKAEFEAVKAECAELKQYKANKEFEIAHNERMAVMAEYASIEGTDEYKALVDEIDKYSKEQIIEKADAIVGKYARQGKQFSFEKKAETGFKPVIHLEMMKSDDNTTTPAYGGIFD